MDELIKSARFVVLHFSHYCIILLLVIKLLNILMYFIFILCINRLHFQKPKFDYKMNNFGTDSSEESTSEESNDFQNVSQSISNQNSGNGNCNLNVNNNGAGSILNDIQNLNQRGNNSNININNNSGGELENKISNIKQGSSPMCDIL